MFEPKLRCGRLSVARGVDQDAKEAVCRAQLFSCLRCCSPAQSDHQLHRCVVQRGYECADVDEVPWDCWSRLCCRCKRAWPSHFRRLHVSHARRTIVTTEARSKKETQCVHISDCDRVPGGELRSDERCARASVCARGADDKSLPSAHAMA